MKEYKEKFIAYIDILGFKELVKQAEEGECGLERMSQPLIG